MRHLEAYGLGAALSMPVFGALGQTAHLHALEAFIGNARWERSRGAGLAPEPSCDCRPDLRAPFEFRMDLLRPW